MNERYDSAAEKYHFIVPLWGAKYVDMFVNYSLPSQLAPDNLPALPAGMTNYEIFTVPEDAQAIWHSESVRKLRGLVNVTIRTFREQDVMRDLQFTDHTYVKNLQKMTWCYQQAVNACRGIDAAFVFMTPDSIWGNGAFRYMHECQSSGVRALMALGLITVRPLVQERLAEFTGPDPSIIDIPPRQLVTLACDALHPLGISRIVKDGSARWNSAFYWMKPGQGMVARCFYLHPIMVRPRVHLERMPSTVDYRYVQQACPDFGDVQIVTDSDDLFYIDMADLRHVDEALNLENYTPEKIVDWMCEWTDAYHQAYFAQPILVHEQDVEDEFEEELTASAAFAAELLERYADYQPISGRTLFLSNVFQGQQPPAVLPGAEPAKAEAAAHSTPVPDRALLRLFLDRAKALPRRLVRFAYRRLLSRLYARIDRLDSQLGAYRSQAESLNRDIEQLSRRVEQTANATTAPAAPSDSLKGYVIRAEYELQREVAALRSALESQTKGRHVTARTSTGDGARALRMFMQ